MQMKSAKLYLSIIFCIVMCIGTAWAGQVIWIEAEDFDPDRSTLQSNAVNLTWVVKEKDDPAKEAFGDKYLYADGSHDKTGSSGPVYALPEIEEKAGWVLWARRIMPTSGSDSFFYEVRNDDKWQKPPSSQVNGETLDWAWKQGNASLTIDKGEGNFLRISERESGFSIDLLCLRNDGKTPTDEEYNKYLEDAPKRKFAVDSSDKLTVVWGDIKRY
jgi:hypothetical protein